MGGGRRDGIQIPYSESSLCCRFFHLKKRLAFCLIVVGSVRPTIHQPLALDAFQGEITAYLIVNAKPNAVRVAEIVLAQASRIGSFQRRL